MIGRRIDDKYQIMAFIGEGGMSTVWLAVELHTHRKFALRFLKKGMISSRLEDIIRFRNEATRISKLNIPGTIKMFEIGEFEAMPYLVMEYPAGDNLQKLLEAGRRFGVNTALEIIYQICQILRQVHRAGVIHRDLGPGNMLIQLMQSQGKEGVAVRLTGFGLAQVRKCNPEEPQALAETYYMSPEQSGAIKRSIDERSDLFSLGVLFYQLLGGVLPFKEQDVDSGSYPHSATEPENLTQLNPQVPPILNKIVLQLLEKEPDNRYQSTEGLARDLEKFRRGELQFELGVNVFRQKLDFRPQLIGRETELAILKSELAAARKGNGSVCLVGGEAGIGKTRLVEEIRSLVEEQKGVYIDGKCFSGVHKIPYGPFIDALNAYLKVFAQYSEEQKAEIRKAVLPQIGDLGAAVLRLNPTLEELLGACPPLVELEPAKEISRFQMVISRLFAALGQIHGVLVLKVDDLQWMDWGSCSLMTQMLADITGYQALILGTYRDEAIPEDYSLYRMIKNAQEEQYPLTQIKLSPFDLDAMKRYVAKLLHESEANVTAITQLIFPQSNGNPFFAMEILKQLIREKAISHQNDCWVVHSTVLDRVQIPATIIDIILKRVGELDEPEIEILSYAAVIGKKFDIEFLFELIEIDHRKVLDIIDKAIGMQLLEEDLTDKGKILFVHDRIKEAFYQSIEAGRLRKLHLKIAKLIEERVFEEPEKAVFDLAYHYTEGQDGEKALQYLYPAALKSQASFAHGAAAEYYRQSLTYLELLGQTGRSQWLDCLQKLGEIDLLIGKSDTAIAYFNQILPLKTTGLEKSRIYLLLSQAYFKQGDHSQCEYYAQVGLRLLGQSLPIKKLPVVWGIVKELGIHLLHEWFPVRQVPERDPLASEKYRLVVWYLYAINWTYTLSDNLKLVGTILKSLNIAERKIGKSKELSLSMMTYGVGCSAMRLYERGFKYLANAQELSWEIGDLWGVAESLMNISYYYLWSGDYSQCIAKAQESAAIFQKIGDFKEYIMALQVQFYGLFFSGDYAKAKAVIDQYSENILKTKDSFAICSVYSFNALYYFNTGDFELAKFYCEEDYNLSLQVKDWLHHFVASAFLGIVCHMRGELPQALQYLEQARNLYEKSHFIKSMTSFIYVFVAEVYITDYLTHCDQFTVPARQQYRNKIRAMCKKAIVATQPWKIHYGLALLVQAKYWQLVGKLPLAEEYFRQSIQHCSKYNLKYDLALTLYQYGLFLQQQNRSSEAGEYWTRGYALFKEMGSQYYQKKIAALIGLEEENANLWAPSGGESG